MDRVGVIQQRRTEKGKTCVEQQPETNKREDYFPRTVREIVQRWQAPKREMKRVSVGHRTVGVCAILECYRGAIVSAGLCERWHLTQQREEDRQFFRRAICWGRIRPSIYNDWYPALRSAPLRGRKMATAMLLGIPLVLGRKEDGSIFAMRDSCPHRGIPLSCGWFDGSAVTCKYHGWVFEPESGQCMEIPSLTSQDTYPRRIYATAFPCRGERRIRLGLCPQAGQRPGTHGGPGCLATGAGIAEVQRPLSQRASDCRSALQRRPRHHRLDGSGAWAVRAPGMVVALRHSIHEKEKHFEPIPQGFRMSAHTPSANSAPYKLLGVYGEPIETTIDFVLPNRRYETLRCGNKWFASLTTVTPTTRAIPASMSMAPGTFSTECHL